MSKDKDTQRLNVVGAEYATPEQPPNPLPRRRVMYLTVAVLIAAFAGTVVWGKYLSQQPSAASPTPETVSQPTPSSAAKVSTDPAPTAVHAVQVLGSTVMFNPTERPKALAQFVHPAVLAKMTQGYEDGFKAAWQALCLDPLGHPPLGQTLVSRAVAVGVHRLAQTKDSATVAVWEVGMAGLIGTNPKCPPVMESWRTVTVTLRWTPAGWRMWDVTDIPGPTPSYGVQTPSKPTEMSAAFRDFGVPTYAS